MPIEFPCAQCNSLLRVPDDTVGKKAKCPRCGMLLDIPQVARPSTDGTFGNVLPSQEMSADGGAVNPYQSPVSGQDFETAPTIQEVKGRVLGPSIGMMVASGLSLLYSAFNLIVILATGVEQINADLPEDFPVEFMYIIFAVIMVFASLIPLMTLWGSFQMLRLRSYTFAMAAAILSLLPCTGCCILSMPFGIWALIVLNDVHVKSAFR